jgi:hypothetical protein
MGVGGVGLAYYHDKIAKPLELLRSQMVARFVLTVDAPRRISRTVAPQSLLKEFSE